MDCDSNLRCERPHRPAPSQTGLKTQCTAPHSGSNAQPAYGSAASRQQLIAPVRDVFLYVLVPGQARALLR